MFDLQMLVYCIIMLIVAGVVFWLLWWLVNYINPPEPFKKVANVILAIAAVLVVIGVLLYLVGIPVFRWGPGVR